MSALDALTTIDNEVSKLAASRDVHGLIQEAIAIVKEGLTKVETIGEQVLDQTETAVVAAEPAVEAPVEEAVASVEQEVAPVEQAVETAVAPTEPAAPMTDPNAPQI